MKNSKALKKKRAKNLDLFIPFDLAKLDVKERKPKKEIARKTNGIFAALDARNNQLPKVRPKHRINKFKHQPIVLSLLKKYWLTLYDIAEECDVTTRTAKKLLAWVTAHYRVETRRHEETAEKEHHIINPLPRTIRRYACFYECCEDLRKRDVFGDIIIVEREQGTFMYRDLAAEYSERSAFLVAGDDWAPIGKDAPARLMNMAEAVSWCCEIPILDGFEIRVKKEIDDDEVDDDNAESETSG